MSTPPTCRCGLDGRGGPVLPLDYVATTRTLKVSDVPQRAKRAGALRGRPRKETACFCFIAATSADGPSLRETTDPFFAKRGRRRHQQRLALHAVNGSDSAVCKAGDEGLRRIKACDVPVSTARSWKGRARGDGEMFFGIRENMQFSASRPDGAPRQGISRPQCAFEVSMFTESCNSHQFSRLAALFIDGRAE